MTQLAFYKSVMEDEYIVMPPPDYDFSINPRLNMKTIMVSGMRRTIMAPGKTEEEARDWVMLKLISGELKLVNMRYQ